MTLIAAFRARNNGILLCADREENDGYSKREIDKIYRIRELLPCEVFIAGAGPVSVIVNACAEIRRSLKRSADAGQDVLVEHQELLKASLKIIHKEYAKTLREFPLGLIIVIAPRALHTPPVVYRTDGEMLIPESLYCSYGSGKAISDYLADRLYKHGLQKDALALLAAFIFREAEQSSSGVGLGTDMIFIHEDDKSLHIIPPSAVKEIEAGVPSLHDAIYSYWEKHAKVPDWLK